MANSILFPAFVNEYKGTESLSLSTFKNPFANYLARASDLLNTDLKEFDFHTNNLLHDELKSQYISFIFSCSVADILKDHDIRPGFVSGYSMGVYAALYYCGSLSFDDGLMMVRKAWESIEEVTVNERYGMGMIIGLDENDLQLMLKNESGVMLCNQNNLYTFVISGLRDAVEKIISQAKTEGAMRTSVLPVSRPYHSHFLKKAVPVFSSAIQKVHFNEAAFTYISSINQEAIRNPEDLRKEVISNLSACMNWYKTMRSLLTPGTNRFFECGAGDGLTRNTRFIHGDFKAYAISRLESFIRECSK